MLSALLLAGALALPSDTLEIRPGDVFVSERLMGQLLIVGWDGDHAEVARADLDVRFVRRGDEVHLIPSRGSDPDGRVHVRIPATTRVRVFGTELETVIDGIEADVEVELLEGDATVDRVTGDVGIATLSGDLRIRDVVGDVRLNTLDGELGVWNVDGDVRMESTDGGLMLFGVRADRVWASTIDGDIEFDGDIAAGGELTLVTHDGDVTLTLDEGVGARVEVGTWDGNFESHFPVRVNSVAASRALRFELGDGSRSFSIRSFDGDIRLLRR